MSRVAAALETLGPRTERALVAFARENAHLLVLSMAFALLAYGYALADPALNLDEQIAPAFGSLGRSGSWNLSILRWGTAVFDGAVLGPANLHVLRPVLALALLSVAATVYARLLPTTEVARAFFCLTFVTVPTFAYAMAFSFLSVEFALMILLFVLGLKSLVEATSGSRPGTAGLLTAVALWVLAQSFYQDYGVVLAASLLWLLFALVGGERMTPWRRAATFVVVLAASIALDLLIASTLIWLTGVPRQAYLARYLGPSTIHGRGAALLRGAIDLYSSHGFPGWLSLRMAAIALPVLAVSMPGPAKRRAGLFLLAIAVGVAPIGYGAGAIPPMRAASGLLFVVAGAAALAVARSPQAITFFVKLGVLYLALQSCVAVNDVFHHESLAWEADRSLAVQLAARIYDVAPDVHDDGPVRVLFVGSYVRRLPAELPGDENWIGAFDTWGTNKTDRRQRAMENAGFPAFRLATEDDYRAALPLIERMPAWPDPRAVARTGDLVVVKLGPANGFAES